MAIGLGSTLILPVEERSSHIPIRRGIRTCSFPAVLLRRAGDRSLSSVEPRQREKQ